MVGLFDFREDFRQTFKKENPDVKAVSAVSDRFCPSFSILG